MNEADLAALKKETAEEKKRLDLVEPAEVDLDKLAAAGDRVKRGTKLVDL